MPIYNEVSYIRSSLQAILNQDYSLEQTEVIIVDGMSKDGTREVVLEIKNQNPKIKIVLLDNPCKIVPVALNAGVNNSKGDIIIRIDGHCEIASDYVSRCIEILQKTGADCVGGHQRPVARGLIGKAVVLATTTRFGTGNAKFRHRNNSGWVDTVYMGAYRREVFDRIGMFDEELMRNQDDEFNFRLIQHEGKIWLDSSIRSKYYCRTTLKGLRKQYFEYGLWKVRVIQKRRGIASWRHTFPSFFVLIFVISLFTSLILKQYWIALGIIVPYAFVTLFVSIWVGRSDWKTILLLPIVFLIIHFSYGLGFILGFWKWRKLGPAPFKQA